MAEFCVRGRPSSTGEGYRFAIPPLETRCLWRIVDYVGAASVANRRPSKRHLSGMTQCTRLLDPEWTSQMSPQEIREQLEDIRKQRAALDVQQVILELLLLSKTDPQKSSKMAKAVTQVVVAAGC